MHPILFSIGPITIYSYGAMLVVALVVCLWLAARVARQLPGEFVAITGERLVDLICLSVLGGIIGGRMVYVLLHREWFWRSPLDALAIWHGGLVWYGGFLGGLLCAWWYARANHLEWWRVADQLAPFIALGHAIGRIGCFFNGCCYGKPTDAWCGVVFPGELHAVIPTQLFEAFGLVGLYLGLRALQRPLDSGPGLPRLCSGQVGRWALARDVAHNESRGRPERSRGTTKWSPGLARGAPPVVLARPGRVFGAYLIGYALLRFVIEPLRGDQTVFWAGLTLQQLISIGVLVAGTLLLRLRVSRFAFRETHNAKR